VYSFLCWWKIGHNLPAPSIEERRKPSSASTWLSNSIWEFPQTNLYSRAIYKSGASLHMMYTTKSSSSAVPNCIMDNNRLHSSTLVIINYKCWNFWDPHWQIKRERERHDWKPKQYPFDISWVQVTQHPFLRWLLVYNLEGEGKENCKSSSSGITQNPEIGKWFQHVGLQFPDELNSLHFKLTGSRWLHQGRNTCSTHVLRLHQFIDKNPRPMSSNSTAELPV
jgi:hypothetical protein